MSFLGDLSGQLCARWQLLAPRERLLVGTGAVVVVPLVLYLGLWSPLHAKLDRLRLEAPDTEAAVVRMRVQAVRIQQLRAQGVQTAGGGNLLATLESTAAAAGLRAAITRMEPEGNQGAQLSFDEVSFDQLIAWLNDMQARHGVRVEQASFELRPAAGQVSARLRLKGAS